MDDQTSGNSSKNVGIWIRVSTEDQARGESPEHHERRARYYADSKGWTVREVYHLEGISGKTVLKASEAQRMVADIKSGHITGLIFSKLARLARNTKELLELADLFRIHSADLISLQESIDTSTPAGRFFYTNIAAMAQWEREEISDRVGASVPIRAKLGKPLGGQAPFGYQWQDRKLVIEPKEAPIRKKMYELFLEHRRKKTVARLLNEAGYRTRNGSKFSDTTIHRLLRDSIAKGHRRSNYTKSSGDKKHWVLKPADQWVFSDVPAIISEDLWNECNHLLDLSELKLKRPSKKTVHLFAGYAHCMCGQKMYVPSNTPKYVCYSCRNKIPIGDLEAVFQEQLRTFVIDPKQIVNHLEKAHQGIRDKQALLQSLETERDKVGEEADKLYQLYIANEISAQGFGRKHKPLEERLNQLEDQIPKLQGEIDFLKIQQLSGNQVLADMKDLHSQWPTLEPQEKRQLIEIIMEEIIVGKDEITIRLNYLPSDENLKTQMAAASSSKLVAERQRNLRDSSQQSTRTMPGTSASFGRARS
jgi:site-specific DNA recombinase